MRNYVIINGVNSLTIQGLAIKTLPPITKPIQRNLREEIDGRDGDIVTTLGYGAYDKTIEIGLFGTFDIDEVIAYFNQKGTITFSNEVDKVYYFEALDQVDYAELLKFRTANVVLHCQPFKYPTEETPLVEEYEYVEATGTNVTLDNTSEAIFNKIELIGNASQDGTPTPDAPIPVSVVSGDNYINICGKNLFDKDNIISGYRLDGSGNPSSSASNEFTSGFIPVESGATYIRSYGNISAYTRTCFYDKSKSFVSKNDDSQSFTIPSNVKYIRFSEYLTRLNTMQLEKGSTATTYEPYIGNTYEVNLGDIELCKIGTYQDYIYKDNGSWYLHKEIGKVVLDGSENWGTESAYTDYYRFTNSILLANLTNSSNAMNNRFFQRISQAHGDYEYLYIQSDNGTLHIQILPSRLSGSSANDFKNWLSTHNTIVYYVLATPTTTQITDTNLIEQLESLSMANSIQGQTNISQENNDLPFILSVSTLKDGSDHLVINNIGNIYAKPTLDLEGNGIVDIYLNDTQMFEVDLSETNEIVINTQEMEAYNPTTNALANRQVTGDYSKFKLDSGENDLRFSGDLTKATITRYERWL